ncbi:hypothetical protein B0J13DRAFT_547807 [Dactylonectria estremocensis]|uniref:Uncharacterized protein n=1 Tax=Dactylonectria estremocensis TaxID=1079267 RepID=A0A9P9J7E1_9HYPO|nr:hypothetical protein B0J13DRAFT_547807 [Dactylonectria estremocensis]
MPEPLQAPLSSSLANVIPLLARFMLVSLNTVQSDLVGCDELEGCKDGVNAIRQPLETHRSAPVLTVESNLCMLCCNCQRQFLSSAVPS